MTSTIHIPSLSIKSYHIKYLSMSSGLKLYVNPSANIVSGKPPAEREAHLSERTNTTPTHNTASVPGAPPSSSEAASTPSASSSTPQRDPDQFDASSRTSTQNLSASQPNQPEKATTPGVSLQQDGAQSEPDTSSTPAPATILPVVESNLDQAQASKPSTMPSVLVTPPHTTRFCCKRDGCRASANEIPELRRHTKTTRGVQCVSTAPLQDNEIESVSWMQWFRGGECFHNS